MEQSSKFIIRPSRLFGSVNIDGAKNSALKLLAASLLTEEKVEISNYPARLLDLQTSIAMLRSLGKECLESPNGLIISESSKLKNHLQWNDRSIRTTLLILGSLVARMGEAAVPLPGGCQIGERKYDLHEMVLREMGADVWVEGNTLFARAKGRLKGTDIHLPIRSTGATENAILCGSLAIGTTRIWNPHIRPEILDLVSCLKKMGAKINTYGQEHIEVQGVERLTGTQHTVIGDNMEAITWLVASVVTNGDIEIINFPFDHLEVPLVHLRESGAKFFRGQNSLIVRGGRCYPVDIATGPYPGINSDMQPLFAVYGFYSQGESRIIDLRFPGRYNYASEIGKMGGSFKVEGDMLRIFGGNRLRGTTVAAGDLRAGAALSIAALAAEGETVIEDFWQVTRGYNNFAKKLISLGGRIESADVND